MHTKRRFLEENPSTDDEGAGAFDVAGRGSGRSVAKRGWRGSSRRRDGGVLLGAPSGWSANVVRMR